MPSRASRPPTFHLSLRSWPLVLDPWYLVFGNSFFLLPSSFRLPSSVYRLAFVLCLSSFVISLSACSLAEDITPPPGLPATATAAAQSAAAALHPDIMPDPATGAAIFAEHCVQCHGPAGKGDGPMAAQVQGQLPDFSLAAFRRTHAPQDWFTVITTGRLEQTMPPFADALDDSERWDVTAYLYTLSVSTPMLEQGQELYTAHCAACHGAIGQGNGPQSVADLPDFTSPEFFATTFEQEFYQSMTEGVPTSAHVFTDSLTEDERWAVAAHVRALGYQSQSTVPANGQVTVQGKVTHGTAGASVPSTLPVVLHVFQDVTETQTYTTTLSRGVYTFADLPLQPQQSLVVTADYAEVLYLSEIIQLKGIGNQINLPIKIFETTTDPTAIRVGSWSVFFQANQAGMVQVGELINFDNTGDRTFVAPQTGEATLEIPLPPGATDLQFEDGALGERYLATAEGFAHTSIVRPGAKTLSVLFSFDLPLAGRLDFTQTVRYPVQAMNVLAPNGVLEVKSGQLSGPQTENVEGSAYLIYTGAVLSAGDHLAMTVSPPNANANLIQLGIGGSALLAVVGLGAWWWFGLRKKFKATGTSSTQRLEALIQTLAQLDERFASGNVSEANHRAQRAKLKAEALKLMEVKDDV